MSPGLAARIRTASGRKVFIKAVSPELNTRAPSFYRREAMIAPILPDSVPAPRLLWSLDEGDDGWVILAFEEIDGRQPVLPWIPAEIDRVVSCLVELTAVLIPSPIASEHVGRAEAWGVVTGTRWEKLAGTALDQLDDWFRRHINSLVAVEATAAATVAGETLLHLDIRDDNLLLSSERVILLDWTHARIGAPWLDIVLFAPSVAMQGGPDPETLIQQHPSVRTADPDAITATVAAIAGSLTYGGLQPPPPGLPALPAFMEAQAVEARRWLRVRTGWK
jgi:aminoglycoside phosphotransferase (APT) family kinase protein